MPNSYRVVVTGKMFIEDASEVRKRLLDIFDLPEPQLAALLSGKALVIKKNIDASSAIKYKKALSTCGLEVLVEPMNEAPIVEADELDSKGTGAPVSAAQVTTDKAQPAVQKPQPTDQQSPDTQASQPEKSEPKPSEPQPDASKIAAEIKMAPAGARIGPRPSVARHDIPETDHLKAEFAERLAPEVEDGPPPPDVSHIDIAEVGETLMSPKEQPALQVDVSHLDVAEVGVTLVESTDVEPLVLDLDNLDMAPVGETLSKPKEVPPLEVDLSHISMDEP